ncbi:MAG: nucleoside-diphosphate kinase [Candidatus Pacebacteria bacterium]|jgi:nucleoside-diphosphate kinase|nr:nucleoside-diphosphate kinase [Candidatus Paceibacterota bacterium]MDD4994370.1 nucleoside-diphosphate kinase [Candidatus Paceibacterota bacterium]MDD5535075.1 nucleoside-diphosphate kinase [Candidatus Paceibacterota bacterium]
MSFKNECALVLIKPDGIQRSLIGEIISRYERTGLKLLALKFVLPTEDLVEKHYSVDPNWKINAGEKSIQAYKVKNLEPPYKEAEKMGEVILERLKKYLSCGPVVAMVWQGMNAVGVIKKITGGTDPLASNVGTIRGDFTLDSCTVADVDDRAVRNLVHASGTPLEAEKEISLWFKPEELIQYSLVGESILYDVNLDGILE